MVPKATVRLNNLIETLKGLRKTVILMITIYYRERLEIKISNGKRCMGQVQEKSRKSF